MRVRSKASKAPRRFSISMTPLIDVVFLLMIFFLMTINFQRPEMALQHRLPQLGEQADEDPARDWETVRISVKMREQNGTMQIYLQERLIQSYTELRTYLDQLPDDIEIVLEPDKNVPYKHVVGVYNTCIQSSKQNIAFSLDT